ncbi:MAG: metallophosphoesterase [Candidatus Caldarchaeum sp.]
MNRRALLVSSAAAAVSAGVAVLSANEAGRLETSFVDAGLGSLVVFLPDLHLHSLGAYEESLIESVNRIQPDVVVLGGDMVDELTSDVEVLRLFVSQLDAREKLFVLGNHDYWSGHSEAVLRILREQGWVELSGFFSSRWMGRVHGLDWVNSRRYPNNRVEGVVVVHDPNAADYVEGPCYILSGHTHGGLVLGGHVVYSNSKYVRGFYSLGEKKLYVSRGLGQMIPFRISSPPEMLVIR